MHKLIVFSGNAHIAFAEEICKSLDVPLGKAVISRFSDGEVRVKIEENVRGKDIFVVQPTCPPVNDHLMELLVIIDALKRASAARITAVIPYYAYSRQDRKDQPRVPISAKLVANLLTVAGASRVLTMDLHAGQIQGFFDIPLDNLYAINNFVDFIKKNMQLDKLTVVSPDVGGIKMVRAYSNKLQCPLAIVDKSRFDADKSEVMNILGDVKGRNLIMIDDLIATGGSLVNAAEALKEKGAKDIYAMATHGIFAGNAIERIEKSCLKKVYVTNTMPLRQKSEKIEQISVASLFAEAIKRIHWEVSISCLFDQVVR